MLNASVSPVTAVVSAGGTTTAASVVLTAKAPVASQNGPIQLSLITTPVRAAAASLSGGGGTSYDTGTVTANVNGTSLTASYGQTSTAQTIAQSLASSINAGNLGVTALAGANGALAVTANQPGSAGDSIVVTLSSSTSDPGLFSSPSFTGSSATLSGGTDPVLSPGTIYSYAIPSPPAANAGYAGNGNLLSYTDSVNGQWTAHYDTLNRLSTATVAGTSPATLAWSYDAFGNRKSQTPGGTTYSYPAANNRVSTFPYDASGDVLDDGRNQYGYDGEGRLCTVYNKTLLTYTGYVYDGMGNRVASGTGMSSLSCNNSFTPSKTFVTGPNGEQLDQLSGIGAVYSNVFANGQLLATYQYSGSNWTFALNDWLGTKRVVANANGTQAEACTGYPFGDGMNCSGTGGDPSPQHFTGKVRDVESNNDYFGARYYSNNVARGISPDPSNQGVDFYYPQTWNHYAYGLNNPLSTVDNDGFWPTGVHSEIIDRAFPGLSNEQRQNLKTASQNVDHDQSMGGSYKHGMSAGDDPNGSVNARQSSEDFIKQNEHDAETIQAAWLASGHTGIAPAALAAFGNALHTITDETSPSHEGFQSWYGVADPLEWLGDLFHLIREVIPSASNARRQQNAVDAGQAAFLTTFGHDSFAQATHEEVTVRILSDSVTPISEDQ